MGGEIFYWIFNMSIAASITGTVILIIEKIKKLPRRMILLLWAIPFLRMCLPAAPSSKYGLMALISMIKSNIAVIHQKIDGFTYMNYIGASQSYFPIIYKTNFFERLFCLLFVVWLTGTVVILIVLGIFYITSIHSLKNKIHLKDNIYISEKLDSPAVYGMFHPKIILPCGYENKDLTFILAHEHEHIRHADNFWRMAAFVLTAFHWFNPFAWIFLRHFLIAVELACDERVLIKIGEEKKKEYALTLINCAESRNIFVSSFGGSKLCVRIKHIISYKKCSLFSFICFVDFTIAAICMLLTNAL